MEDRITEIAKYFYSKAGLKYLGINKRQSNKIISCLHILDSINYAKRFIDWYTRSYEDDTFFPDFDMCFDEYRNMLEIIKYAIPEHLSSIDYYIHNEGAPSIIKTFVNELVFVPELINRDINFSSTKVKLDEIQEKLESRTTIKEEKTTELSSVQDNQIRKIVEKIIAEEKLRMGDDLKKELIEHILNSQDVASSIVSIKVDTKKLKPLDKGEIIHEKLDLILQFIVAKEPVYLVGPAGSGKNHICKQISRMLGLDFYFSNAVTQEYKITGFTDANGVYHESQFYKAFKYGGLFMIDEADASISEVFIILNAAIANGYFDFPAPIGYVEAHKNFRVVAAGNTWGYGADMQYVGRNQLDMATLDRFAVVEVTYSPAVELRICPDTDMLNFLRDYRRSILDNGIMSVVSYRSMRRMYIMENSIESLPVLLDTCLCKGICKDDLKNVYNKLIVKNKYTNALKKLIERRTY